MQNANNFENLTSTTADTGANMQTANTTPAATQPRTIVEQIKDANLDLVNLEFCELNAEQQLYEVLGKCYDICEFLDSGRDTAALYAFDEYYKTTDFKKTSKVSLISKVLNCTFEDLNISKRSAYKAVIQFAAEQKIASGGFVAFVNGYGGLQNARLAKYAAAREKSNAPDYGTRIQQTQNYFAQKQLVKVPEVVMQAALTNVSVDTPFVLIATLTSDGEVVFNVSSADSKAVNAVYNVMYGSNKQQINNAAKASLQTTFPPTGTAPVPPNSFAAGAYSTDALSNNTVQDLINNAEARFADEEAIA